ncbi:MAG TPA: deoxyribodipyrimidine photo-lyase [Polyangiales bacterium]
MKALLWFRGKDLRVADHAALDAACRSCDELIPLFVLAPRYFKGEGPTSAPHRLQFLLDALRELAQAIAERGSKLHIVEGPATVVIPQLVERWKIDRVLTMRSADPQARARDERLKAMLRARFETFEHETLTPVSSVKTGSGAAFQVYTPFARAAMAQLDHVTTLPAPTRLPPLPAATPASLAIPSLPELALEPNPNLQRGGETIARERLAEFVAGSARHYDVERDRLDRASTSRLSADLHFGTLSVRTIWSEVSRELGHLHPNSLRRYRAELLWRDFAYHTLFDRPNLLREPFRSDFIGFPWLDDDAGFEAWWRGGTGYPVVDAAARQLLREGFVHNRARMIAASFLTKHLLVHYQRGEHHYLRYLTDGDLAQNNMGWQWCAGSGCDAQPYFRIFNPVTQGQRFDPHGDYVRRYVPELARMPTRYIHAPWLAPPNVLRDAEVTLGVHYPEPIVEHATARQRYLLVAGEHLKHGSKRSARA